MARERLQKILSRAGLLSRRRAEEAITQGRVAVNGEIKRELGAAADPDVDQITLDRKPVVIEAARKVILLHKPKGSVTTRSDPEGRPTVMELLPEALRSLKPVGRLDLASEGLLLLTDDGELLLRLTHPRYGIEKMYRADVKGAPGPDVLKRLTDRVELEDGPGRFERVRMVESSPAKSVVEIVVTEGRNRFVRRMLEAVNHPVQRLVRVRMGPIALGGLKPGAWRELSGPELDLLRKASVASGKA